MTTPRQDTASKDTNSNPENRTTLSTNDILLSICISEIRKRSTAEDFNDFRKRLAEIGYDIDTVEGASVSE